MYSPTTYVSLNSQITEVLAQQHAELTNLHEQYENKDTEGHLRLGK